MRKQTLYLVYHLRLAKGRVFIRSSDTDVLVIVIGISDRLCDVDVVMEFGIGATRRFIQITDIDNNLESTKPGLPKALLGFHALTGSDYTSCFYRKGKSKPLTVLENDDSHISSMNSMVTENPDMEGITRFVCHIYGFKTESSINHARFLSFKKMTGGKLSRVKTVKCRPAKKC